MQQDQPEGLEDLTELELAWPTRFDTLQPVPGARGLVAPIQTEWSGEHARIDGFRAAAQIIGQRLIAGNRTDETLLYPFASLWRHHLELQLKVLLPDLEQLLGLHPSQPSVYEHSLTKLWAAVDEKIAQVFPEDDAARRNVGRVLKQLAMLDPDGQHFRYARRRNGTRTLPDFKGIDAASFQRVLTNASSYLDATATGAGYLLGEIDTPSLPEN